MYLHVSDTFPAAGHSLSIVNCLAQDQDIILHWGEGVGGENVHCQASPHTLNQQYLVCSKPQPIFAPYMRTMFEVAGDA